MPIPLASESLILFPQDWRTDSGDPEVLADVIDSIRLGTIRAGGFSEGERFGEHIAFMGCAPAVRDKRSEAVESGSGPRITIDMASGQPNFYFLSGRLNPRCPACRRRLTDETISEISLSCSTETEVSCSRCRENYLLGDLRWKQSAGFARMAIRVAGIFPFEAIPQPGFLQALEESGVGSWNYCYADACIECNDEHG